MTQPLARFRIGETVYNAASVQRVTLRQALGFQRSTAELGDPMTWQQAQQRMADFLDRLNATDNAKARDAVARLDPDFVLTVAVIVWSARLAAGEDLLWEDALDIGLDEIEWLESPTDRRPRKDPPQARPAGSGRAAEQRGSSRRKRTSKKR